jgi:hypothetical protein
LQPLERLAQLVENRIGAHKGAIRSECKSRCKTVGVAVAPMNALPAIAGIFQLSLVPPTVRK